MYYYYYYFMYKRDGVPRSEDKYDILLSLLPLLLLFFSALLEEKNIRLARDDDGRNIMYNIKIKLTGRRHHFRLYIFIYIYVCVLYTRRYILFLLYTYSNNNNNNNTRLYILLCIDRYSVAETHKKKIHSVIFFFNNR